MNKEEIGFFYNLETNLHKKEFRNSIEKVSGLLADDFMEFGKSGTVHYKTDTLQRLGDEGVDLQIGVSDFAVRGFSPEAVLVTYTASMLDREKLDSIITKRCSIWVFREERWQMVFHQGTLKQAV